MRARDEKEEVEEEEEDDDEERSYIKLDGRGFVWSRTPWENWVCDNIKWAAGN